MLQDFLNKGTMRVNEKGKFEIIDPRKLENLQSPKFVQKQQQQSQ